MRQETRGSEWQRLMGPTRGQSSETGQEQRKMARGPVAGQGSSPRSDYCIWALCTLQNEVDWALRSRAMLDSEWQKKLFDVTCADPDEEYFAGRHFDEAI
jgi:hypothetical protein